MEHPLPITKANLAAFSLYREAGTPEDRAAEARRCGLHPDEEAALARLVANLEPLPPPRDWLDKRGNVDADLVPRLMAGLAWEGWQAGRLAALLGGSLWGIRYGLEPALARAAPGLDALKAVEPEEGEGMSEGGGEGAREREGEAVVREGGGEGARERGEEVEMVKDVEDVRACEPEVEGREVAAVEMALEGGDGEMPAPAVRRRDQLRALLAERGLSLPLRADEATRREWAAALGCSESLLATALAALRREYERETGESAKPPVRQQQILAALKARGYSPSPNVPYAVRCEVADSVGTSIGTVSHYCRKLAGEPPARAPQPATPRPRTVAWHPDPNGHSNGANGHKSSNGHPNGGLERAARDLAEFLLAHGLADPPREELARRQRGLVAAALLEEGG